MLAMALWTALGLTAAWVFLQVAWMHVRPARNRIRAMTLGYLFSLPWTWPLFRVFEAWGGGLPPESRVVGIGLAFLLALLFFLLYVECFYHIERSVTLRFLVEIRERSAGASPPTVRDIQGSYHLEDMIERRLGVLRDHGFIEQVDGRWVLKPKGRRLCRPMAFSCWLFQSKTQDERL